MNLNKYQKGFLCCVLLIAFSAPSITNANLLYEFFEKTEYTLSYCNMNNCLVTNNDTGEQFTSIQKAIDDEDTKDGHTLYAESCTYHERLIIDKNISLVGADKTTIIDGDDYGTVITIVNGSVIVRNFMITGSGDGWYDAGIAIIEGDNVEIIDVWFNDVHRGIWIQNSAHAKIHDNEFDDGAIRIYGEELHHYLHDIINNKVNEEMFCYYKNQSDIVIKEDCASVILVNCNDIEVTSDFIGLNTGLQVAYSSNVCIHNAIYKNNLEGIIVENSTKITIENSSFSLNTWIALSLSNCTDSVIKYNDFLDNMNYSISTWESSSCTIRDNQILGNGYGIGKEFDLEKEIDFQMGTFSKAFGGFGGMFAGSEYTVKYAWNTARSWLLSAAFPPHVAAVNLAAMDIVENEPERVKKLWDHTKYFKKEIESLGFDTGYSQTPIIPAIVGDSKKAQTLANKMYEEGIFALAIVFPMVARDKARIRNQMNAGMTRDNLDGILRVYEKLGKELDLV